MKLHRPERVASLIKEQLSRFWLKEVEVEGVLITLTDVEMDGDLQKARVKISVWPSDRGKETLAILSKRRGEFQHFLNKKINIKPMPRIEFEIDLGPERAAQVEKALLDE